MKGLWVKDLIFLNKQKLAVLITFILAVFCLAVFGQVGIVIGMTIFSMTVSIITMNSLTFDQQNHGMRYLLTMPFTKKQFVIQKYTFLVLTIIGSVVLMSIASGIYTQIAKWDLGGLGSFARIYGVGIVMLLIFMITIQYQIKHGPEKAQVAMSIIGAVVAVTIGGVIALVKYTMFGKEAFDQLFTYFVQHGSSLFLIVLTVIGAIVVIVSCINSVRALEKMEV